MTQLTARCISCGILLAATIAASGCQKALFGDELPRTQYERYQVLRGKYRPEHTENAFGAQRPALRQRLAPLEQP